MTFDSKEARALVDLIRSAVKFANLAAGEGVSIADLQPEDFLMAYTDATGFDDWDNLDSHAADALTDALDEIERLTAEIDRLSKGSICEVAATNPSVMEYMRHWEGRAEKAETERDALVAAAYEVATTWLIEAGIAGDHDSDPLASCIRALTPADAQAALDKMLAEARLEGWRAGRDAAAHACDWGDIYGDNAVRAIRALPEPKETSHD